MAASVSKRAIKFVILGILDEPPDGYQASNTKHKYDFVGTLRNRGLIEHRLDVEFEPDERAVAAQAFEELMNAGLIRPDFTQYDDRDAWAVITDTGRLAVQNRALDPLDKALQAIDPGLVECRDGAWSAIAQNNPDADRQAAVSLRSLLTNLNPMPSRGNRFAGLIPKYKPHVSSAERKFLDTDAVTLNSEYARLCKLHDLGAFGHREVEGSLRVVETILERFLL